jgi:hypothetical protein
MGTYFLILLDSPNPVESLLATIRLHFGGLSDDTRREEWGLSQPRDIDCQLSPRAW